MRTYEALYIVRPELDDGEVQTIAKNVENLVTSTGGAIVRSEIWGKRRLAYEVQKCTEGHYILLRFTAAPGFVARLENYFRLTDAVIRYLVAHFDEQMLRLEAQQQKRKQAEAHAAASRPEPEDAGDDDRRRRPGRRYNDDDDDEGDDEE